MKAPDENDRLVSGTLPATPFEDASPYAPTNGSSHSAVRKLDAARKPALIRGDHVELAQRLISQLASGSKLVFSDGALWKFDGRLFVSVPDAEKSRVLQSFAGLPVGEKGTPLKIGAHDVRGAIELGHHRVADADFFAGAPAGLAFANGFLPLEDLKLRSHAAQHRARFAYPFAYDAHARPVRWLQFLADVFRDDEDRNDKIACLQEFAGACAFGIAPRFQRAIVEVGVGANGKSVSTAILDAAMPPGSTCAIPPQAWGNEYRLALLAGKRLNVVSELPEADIIDSEAFKAVVSGDGMTARHIRQPPFGFRSTAGHLFAANRLPGTADQTWGFWRRFIVIEFARVFEQHEQVPDLAVQILATELPAIAAWLIDGARRVIKTGAYTVPASSKRAVEEWRRGADQVAMFKTECTSALELDRPITDGVTARQLYGAFRAWAERNGHRPLASNKFGERMRLLGAGSTHTKVGKFYPLILEQHDGEDQ
jgi:P4 family phage/plasmid primase-like protien